MDPHSLDSIAKTIVLHGSVLYVQPASGRAPIAGAALVQQYQQECIQAE